jgi:hypothetical protein
MDNDFENYTFNLKIIVNDLKTYFSFLIFDPIRSHEEGLRLSMIQGYISQLDFLIGKGPYPDIVIFNNDIIDIIGRILCINCNDESVNIDLKNIKDWATNEHMQRSFIKKHPEFYLSFKRNNFLLPEIEKEYFYLQSALDLDLL